ncbi:MAG: hypothetical protein AAFO91_17710 [Bacteroidota bacterium]
MHHPLLFKWVHLIHHRSTNPSPWASYSFHILEAILEVMIAPIILVLVPMHPLEKKRMMHHPVHPIKISVVDNQGY